MKLATFFALAATAFSTANAEFVTMESTLIFNTASTVSPTTAERSFLDVVVKDSYLEANAGGDFVPENVEIESVEIGSTRRKLREQGRKLPGNFWRLDQSSGGSCSYCGGWRKLEATDENNRNLTSDPAVAALVCSKLTAGPFPKFHDVTNCQISFMPV